MVSGAVPIILAGLFGFLEYEIFPELLAASEIYEAIISFTTKAYDWD